MIKAKNILIFIILVLVCVCAVLLGKIRSDGMQFNPNMELIKHYDEVEQDNSRKPPYVAIYRLGKKTLVYMADEHAQKSSWNMVDWCFSEKFAFKPDILLTEFENAGRELKHNHTNTLSHAAFVAARHGVPVVLADLSESQMMSVIDTDDKNYLSDVLHAGPNRHGTDLQVLSDKVNVAGRNPFMVQNIAAALNKYDTVFCIFGEGHFREQRAVLDGMFGKQPDEYITEFPDMNTGFGKIDAFQQGQQKVENRLQQMEIIRLVEFEKGKDIK